MKRMGRVIGVAGLLCVASLSHGQLFIQVLSGVSGLGSLAYGTGHAGTFTAGKDATGPYDLACRWTFGATPISLGVCPGDFFSGATALSDDGAVVVGSSSGVSVSQPFRWEASTGTMTGLGNLLGKTNGCAYGVSGDGATVVGTCWSGYTDSVAFIWTAATGMQQIGASSPKCSAKAISRNGIYVCGTYLNNASNTHAYRWDSTSGIVSLGNLPGGSNSSSAMGISSAGDVVVGNSSSANGTEAFYWKSTGMVGLGDLPGGAFNSVAWSCSKGGSAIVGYGTDANGVRAFVWNSTLGMVNLQDYLTAHGVNMTGWSELTTATSISEDGKVIVGYGKYNGVQSGFRIYYGAGWQNAT